MGDQDEAGRDHDVERPEPPVDPRPEGGHPMPVDEPDAGYGDADHGVAYAEDDPHYNPGGADAAGAGSESWG